MVENKIIIPVASGKGGVGKSIFTANLAISLAKSNYKTVAADLDLGGSNLYTYLGLGNEYPGIGDYVREKNPLTNYLVQTQIPNLHFLPGEGRTTFLANIHHAQKIKLIKEIRKLHAQYILLDLGAGTTYNTLDYFGLSHNGIIVSTFDLPALKNTLTFLKNFIFRVVSKQIPKSTGIAQTINEALKNSTQENPLTMEKLIDIAHRESPETASQIREICNLYRPRIVFNLGNEANDLKILKNYDRAIKSNLSLNIEYFGYIFYDENVNASVKSNSIFILEYPECIAAKSINHISRRIIRFGNQAIPESIEKLMEDTNTIQEKWFVNTQ